MQHITCPAHAPRLRLQCLDCLSEEGPPLSSFPTVVTTHLFFSRPLSLQCWSLARTWCRSPPLGGRSDRPSSPFRMHGLCDSFFQVLGFGCLRRSSAGRVLGCASLWCLTHTVASKTSSMESKHLIPFSESQLLSNVSQYPPATWDREDTSRDARFYSQPRLVTHIDDAAIERLTHYYGAAISAALERAASEHPPRRKVDDLWVQLAQEFPGSIRCQERGKTGTPFPHEACRQERSGNTCREAGRRCPRCWTFDTRHPTPDEDHECQCEGPC